MKVIFLDIDGVLNDNFTQSKIFGYDFVDDDKVERLKTIIDATGAKVVLSSTWRDGWYDWDEGLNTLSADMFIALEKKLRDFGVELFDKTPMPTRSRSRRGEEITYWLDHQNDNIEAFVILEDFENLFPCSEDHIVWTDPSEGLTEECMELAIDKLNKII